MATPLPEDLPDSFRVRDGLREGVGLGRQRGRDLSRPHWGIRGRREPTRHSELALAFAPRMPDRAFLFGLSAAAVHGIPLPQRLATNAIHVGVPAGGRRIDSADVRPHHVRIHPADVIVWRGTSITTLERTWCDLGASGLTVPELVAAGDHLLWWRRPRTTTSSLEAALVRYDSRRGSRLLRVSLSLLCGRADSPPESEIRVAICDAGLPAPTVNMPVYDSIGRFVAQPDLTWMNLEVALEYEGDHLRTNRDQWHRDIERYARLQELGWIIIRATASDYRDPRRLIARLSRALASRA